ncbi:GNAT superfamily N-acetyltransferase [Methylopila capsulata]|uniref:N-acetyltransferase n=1 Tax=Methylopila capsulata TaxID=61654 RepID=A0A9W6IVH8_9HYPH|nr:GNAT family N-acetyltransferase [Methylopila capsulata]MBM7850785.1 GNAT superfamily N-acetyltransferase [Methylopila capsulata]GLK56079.1 N-acetyltransferase [Methylopila capsulata]
MNALTNGLYDIPFDRLPAIITYLERTAPLDEPPAALPAGVAISAVERPRADWYRALFRCVGDDWLWFDRLRLTDAALQELLDQPERRLLLMTRGEEEIGFAELEPPSEASVEIVYFGLVKEAGGAGLGRALMRAALVAAFRPGVGRVWLHTCNFDAPGALAFYDRMGFRAYAQKIEISDDPRLTGLLPRHAAPHVPLRG